MRAEIATGIFAAAAVAYGLLAFMMRPRRRSRSAAESRLRLAALGTVLAAAAGAAIAAAERAPSVLSDLVLLAIVALWLWQLEVLLRDQRPADALQPALRWLGPTVFGLSLLAALAPGLAEQAPRVIGAIAIGGVLLAVLGLVTLEQLYRNSAGSAVPAVRWFSLGVGVVMLCALAQYAERLLTGSVVAETWAARGLFLGLAAYPIARGARSMPQWCAGLFVSRQVVFYTTSFFVIGAYLLAMSLIGWAMLGLSGAWAQFAQAAFTTLAGLVLAALLFSGALRRRLMVFISKNFYRNRYDYRVEWLRFIATLSQANSETSIQQRAIRAVAQIIDSPRGVLWTHDAPGACYRESACWPAGGAPLAGLTIPVEASLPAFLRRTAWLVDLRELAQTPTLYDNLSLTARDLGTSGTALIVPVLHIEQLYGWLVLERPTALGPLTFEDRDLLKTAGRHVAAHLSQFDADVRLTEARQFEAYSRLTAFVMHDLKNLAAQLRLVVQNAERHKRNPEFVDDAMSTIGMSVARMSKLIGQLATGGPAEAPQALDLATVAERVAVRCGDRLPVPQLVIRERPTAFAELEHLSNVIEHAVRNAQDATPESGEIRIEVERDGGRPVLRVVDNGSGMDAAFIRERLFRPFDSTKGARGMGIGAFQIREYLRGLGGAVEVISQPGAGTTLSLIFPPETAAAKLRKTG